MAVLKPFHHHINKFNKMTKQLSSLILASMLSFQASAVVDKNFDYHVDRFADIEVLRYEVPEFDRLSLNQKKMVYYLSQAAQYGRDIIWDQNGRYNLLFLISFGRDRRFFSTMRSSLMMLTVIL